MPVMALDMLKEGLVLVRDVSTREGVLLAPAGTALGAKHIAGFSEAGIASVEVTAESMRARSQTASLSKPSDEAIAARLQQLAKMFAEYKSDPIMREVCRLAIKCAKEGLIGV